MDKNFYNNNIFKNNLSYDGPGATAMIPTANPVLGLYDRIEVRSSTVSHCGRHDVSIIWINQFAFYFKWGPGNEQIWIYDTNQNCLYQICNDIDSGFLLKRHLKHTPMPHIPYCGRNLGPFKGICVYEDKVEHCGHFRNIIWLNPFAFYFKWSEKNEQVWIYDSSVPGYLQLGQWKNSVHAAYSHGSERTHPRQ